MPADFTTARDDIQGALNVDWEANTPAVNGGVIPEIYFDGVAEPTEKPHDKAWARHVIRHALSDVTGIGGKTPGSRVRTTKLGTTTLQVFAPRSEGGGLKLGEDLAKIGKAAFEVKVTANDVIFRNVRINEIGVGKDAPWYQFNVLADFEYDEFV